MPTTRTDTTDANPEDTAKLLDLQRQCALLEYEIASKKEREKIVPVTPEMARDFTQEDADTQMERMEAERSAA